MEIIELAICEKFHCLAGDCPMNCCKGWQIPVDEDVVRAYEQLPGLRGRHMRYHIQKLKKMDLTVVRRIFGRCPFHNSDRLCQLQQNGQTHLMPLICRYFPRSSVYMGSRIEVTLMLSCPAAAQLFLEMPGRMAFVPGKHIIPSMWDIENDDEDFLQYLTAEREKLLDYLWQEDTPGDNDASPVRLDRQWQSLYAYVYHVHDLLVRDRLAEAKTVELSDDPRIQGAFALEKDAGLAFYSIRTIDRMLLEHIDYGPLILRMPRFYHLIRRYMHYFSKLGIREADAFFHDQLSAIMKKEPAFALKYRSYFSYCLQQVYLMAYENYFVLREFLLAVLYTQLLMLFDLVEYLDRGSIPLPRQAQILYYSEHGIRHNPDLTHNLYQVIREEFL